MTRVLRKKVKVYKMIKRDLVALVDQGEPGLIASVRIVASFPLVNWVP